MCKELNTDSQYMDQFLKSVYSGGMIFYQIRSCLSRSQELNNISTETQCLKNLMLSQIIQMLREHKLRPILMLYNDGD